MTPDRVRPLSEADIDFVVQAAGGRRAHSDADKRGKPGADYIIGSALLELKILDEEGFSKPERQIKIAGLFRKHAPDRPVIVLDRSLLPPEEQTAFDRIVEGPIKTAVRKADKQLKQSRTEQLDATCSVLFFVNSGYTTINHEELKALVKWRVEHDVRKGGRQIDAVVVAGAYYHSDGFDSCFLWPIDCITINESCFFADFERLREGWGALSERFMTDAIRGDFGSGLTRGPVDDARFDVDGVTFVKPSPALGLTDFYVGGRPRLDSTGIEKCPPVARTFPSVCRRQWSVTNIRLGRPPALMGNYERWRTAEAVAFGASEPLRPFVTMPVNFAQFARARRLANQPRSSRSFFEFANELFDDEVQRRIEMSQEFTDEVCSTCFIWAVTEVIGKDRADDISHIFLVSHFLKTTKRTLVKEARIFHEYALVLGCAYAVREGVKDVFWTKETKYAWI